MKLSLHGSGGSEDHGTSTRRSRKIKGGRRIQPEKGRGEKEEHKT
jgi:hypothetical protein